MTSWATWYREARVEAEFRYGLRRVPVDRYKEQWALGRTVAQGVRAIHVRLRAEGK